jgi:putative glutamine amidotransferase
VSDRPRIGISACFFHADPKRPIFTGKTLQYVEQSIVHWVQAAGALAVVIPSPEGPTKRGDVTLADYAGLLDGLVLEGGSDMWPGSYGEAPLRPEWTGDRIRDEYEIALLRAFIEARKPVLGVCRGLQVLNVAFGGTLYQDIGTQKPGTCTHRDASLYDQNFHAIDIVGATRLAQLYPGVTSAMVNSVHHQGVKDLAPEFVVEAVSPDDGIVEAFRWTGPSYVAAVQWHPEFHDLTRADLLSGDPLLADFLQATRAARNESAKIGV